MVGKKYQIIFLDDSNVDAEIVKNKLESDMDLDFNFTHVASRDDFIACIDFLKPDLILSDYYLENYTGKDALHDVKKTGTLIPFIFLSGLISEEEAINLIKEGAWDYVFKHNINRLPLAVTAALKLKEEISKVKKAETEVNLLKENIDFHLKILYNAIDQMPVSVVITDKKGIIQYVNPKFEETTGYISGEAIGKSSGIVKSNKQSKDFYLNLWSTILSGKDWKGEIINRKKDGNLFWEEVSISPIFDDNNKIAHFVAIKSEVTQKKEQEKTLKESENLYRTIFNNASHAAAIFNSENIIEIVNPKFELISGYSKVEVEGKMEWTSIIHREDLQMMIDFNTRRKAGDTTVPQEYEFRLVTKMGEIRTVQLSVEIIPGTKNTLTSFIDITENKIAEKELKESKEKFQGLVEDLNDVIFEMDITGKIRYISPSTTHITGYKFDHYTDRCFLDCVYSEDLPQFNEWFKKLIEENSTAPITYRVRNSANKFIWMRASARLISKNNEIVGIKGVAVEVNSLKKIEEELIKAKEKAEESDRLKSSFLANMSHEIRTPLNGIIGFSEMITEPGISEEERELYLSIITESSQQLLHIVNDVLDLSKLETGQMSINNETFDLTRLLQEIISFYTPKAEKKPIALILEKDINYPDIQFTGDRYQLYRAFSNLVDNAVKFTSKGYVKIGYIIKNNKIKFFIKDTGIGIKPEKINVIFERFRQGEDTLTKEYGGTGLGLALSKTMIERMGGVIEVESVPGEGSTFRFSLPFKRNI
ncbi:MAG: PAS domain S-box protein [Prolixibacteraceae bacterium]|nr:PAS domain S-box protein [Prolixibacteraceae bacterium]